MQVLQADIRIRAVKDSPAVCGSCSKVPGLVLRIVRALVVAGIQLVLLLSSDSLARGEESPRADLAPRRQTAIEWPLDDLPGAKLEPLVEDPSAPRPQSGVEKFTTEAASRPVPSPDPTDSDQRPRLNAFWDCGVVLESSDKAFRFHIGGLLEFDNTWYQQTQTLPFLLQDGSDMRRARLRADGSMGNTVDFITEVNFANIQDVTNEDTTTNIGSVGLDDFYLALKQVPVVENVRIGHFKQPIGLEHSTGASNQYYMERSDGHDAFFQPFEFVTRIMFFNSY
jgi:hypothetical protein